MKKADIKVGGLYAAKVNGCISCVRIDYASAAGGWEATNLDTGSRVRIKTAARLRHEITSATCRTPAEPQGETTPGRETRIERIGEFACPIDADPPIRAIVEHLCSDGQYRRALGGVPSNVTITETTRIVGYARIDPQSGCTLGSVFETVEALRADSAARQNMRRSKFREALRTMKASELDRQEEYWQRQSQKQKARG